MELKIKKVNLEKDDIVLFEIDPDIIDLSTANELFKSIQKIFPKNQCMGYVKGFNIHIVKEKDFEYIPVEVE